VCVISEMQDYTIFKNQLIHYISTVKKNTSRDVEEYLTNFKTCSWKYSQQTGNRRKFSQSDEEQLYILTANYIPNGKSLNVGLYDKKIKDVYFSYFNETFC
jgi:hypothetical protein